MNEILIIIAVLSAGFSLGALVTDLVDSAAYRKAFRHKHCWRCEAYTKEHLSGGATEKAGKL